MNAELLKRRITMIYSNLTFDLLYSKKLRLLRSPYQRDSVRMMNINFLTSISLL